MTTTRQRQVFWSADFDNMARHCWFSRGAQVWMREGYVDDRTCQRWRDHPKLRGNVEWRRFISAFRDQLNGEPNPFTNEDNFVLFIEYDGHHTSDGRLTYVETYARRSKDSWGINPTFRVFLDNDNGWARIECYEIALVEACQMALAAVAQSYIDEEEAVPA